MENNKERAREILLAIIDNAVENKFGNLSNLAKSADISQGSLSEFVRGKRKSMQFETVLSLFQAIGDNPFRTIKRIEEYSPIEAIGSDNLISVPVCAYSGAGGAVLYDNLEILETITIPKDYYFHEVKALKILGDSMEPTIQDGAYIGVIPATELHIGKVYLVHQPPFGLVTKRIYQNEQREIVLRSDNKHYVDITVPNEGYNDIIVGRVVWVLQNI